MLRNNRALAHLVLRLAIGINMFGHGFFRILSGVGDFAAHTAEGMSKGPLPHVVSLGFGYCIPWIELALGVLLLLGLFSRFAFAAGGLFIVALTFGTTSVQNWQTAGSQLLYSLVFFILLWHADADRISVDHSRRGGGDVSSPV